MPGVRAPRGERHLRVVEASLTSAGGTFLVRHHPRHEGVPVSEQPTEGANTTVNVEGDAHVEAQPAAAEPASSDEGSGSDDE